MCCVVTVRMVSLVQRYSDVTARTPRRRVVLRKQWQVHWQKRAGRSHTHSSNSVALAACATPSISGASRPTRSLPLPPHFSGRGECRYSIEGCRHRGRSNLGRLRCQPITSRACDHPGKPKFVRVVMVPALVWAIFIEVRENAIRLKGEMIMLAARMSIDEQ